MAIPFANGSPAPAVTFWGAAQSVTGSMHLVEAGGRRILLDCGLARGPRAWARERNCRFPFPAHQIDAVVLSHAHADHCGNLPNLVRRGFAGPIYCTPATRDLLEIILADSARIQEEEAFVLGVLEQPDELECLYTSQDSHQTVRQCIAVPYGRPQAVAGDIRLRFSDAGHILGSAVTSLTIPWHGRGATLTFTGDIGRRGLPFLHPAAPLPEADVVICESTYGGRTHPSRERMALVMADVVGRTVARGGKVLIPAFSLGRTQVVVHYLQEWMRAGRMPPVPIFVDSPLAADIAAIHRRHPACLTRDAVRSLEGPGDPAVEYVRSQEASRNLSTRREPCILVAASGMCEAGRILHHLKHNVDDPRCAVVLVSYQAPGSLGRRLMEPRPTVRFLGRNWNLWAEVVDVQGFSGHADQDDLLAYLAPLAGRTRRVELVHGDLESAHTLAGAVRELGFDAVEVPHLGQTVSLV